MVTARHLMLRIHSVLYFQCATTVSYLKWHLLPFIYVFRPFIFIFSHLFVSFKHNYVEHLDLFLCTKPACFLPKATGHMVSCLDSMRGVKQTGSCCEQWLVECGMVESVHWSGGQNKLYLPSSWCP